MGKEFVIVFINWAGLRDTLWCRADDAVAAREDAYRIMGDLIDIISVEEYTDD